MKNLLTLFGLFPSLTELFLKKRNCISSRLEILAMKYAGIVEISSTDEIIVFRFPLSINDISQKEYSGIMKFYLLERMGWRCSIGEKIKEKPGSWNNNDKTAVHFSSYQRKFDDTIFFEKHSICFEFRESNLDQVRIGATFMAIVDHFKTIEKELKDGFEEPVLKLKQL